MKSLETSLHFLIDNISAKRLADFKKSLLGDELSLLEGILTQGYKSDTEAATQLFQLKSNSVQYQKTKKFLQKKINEQTLFVEPAIKNHPKIYSLAIEQSTIEALIRVYDVFNKRDLNVPLIEKNFPTAYKYFLHTAIIAMCQKMVSFHGLVEHNPKRLSYYSKIYLESINDYRLECLSDLYYQAINTQFGKTQSVNKVKMMAEIEGYVNELNPYENRVRSQKFHLNYYGLQMVYHHIQNDYNSVVAICDKMTNYLKTLPFKSIGPMKQTLKRKAVHLIMLGRYDEALITLNEALPMEMVGSSYWVNCQYLFLLVYIYKKEYCLADQYLQTLLENKMYRSVKSVFKPLISLLNVYLYLFKLMNVIPNNLIDDRSEVKKYMKEHVNYTKDKSGMNIPVIIAQLFEAIILKNDADILDRIEALKKYSSRYITKKNGIRSNCFMNMLIEVVKHNYHLVAIERHCRKYYTKLVANPKISTEEAAEIELIPYEDLWAILMDFLLSKRKVG
jgi:hypothetical protein